MNKKHFAKFKNKQFPVFVEKDEDGFFAAECPLFQGCYSQGKTLDQALKNIKEVIGICLEEKENKEKAGFFIPAELSLHSISLAS